MTEPRPDATGSRLGRSFEIALSVYASVVFVGLWLYVAAAVFTDGALLADTWAWLSGLDTIPAILVWMAILPIAIFLWAWQANLEPLFMGLVMLGLVVWTGIAWSGLVRLLLRPARA